MTYQEDIEHYICGALLYPLKDINHLIAMICLHFTDVNETTARTIVNSLFDRILELDKRSK
uniref:Uncharacterized protein n=1 Tax=viral metagenome TaxID=1070528 RepID=A0A6M3JNS8_9ZZZZ